jgi:hypothetical protein
MMPQSPSSQLSDLSRSAASSYVATPVSGGGSVSASDSATLVEGKIPNKDLRPPSPETNAKITPAENLSLDLLPLRISKQLVAIHLLHASLFILAVVTLTASVHGWLKSIDVEIERVRD